MWERGLHPTAHKHPVAIGNKIAQKYTKHINAMVEIFVKMRDYNIKNAYLILCETYPLSDQSIKRDIQSSRHMMPELLS
jgi:hypothetical protein